jgi:DNA-binding transcriptional regulator GbsR (MarR family)
VQTAGQKSEDIHKGRSEKKKATGGGSLSQYNHTEECEALTRDLRERLVRAGGAISNDLGLGRIWGQVLAYLYLQEGERSMDQIEEDLELSKAAVSIAARQLEKFGLVCCVHHRGDRRLYYRTADTLVSALQDSVLTLLRGKLNIIESELDLVRDRLRAADVDADDEVRFVSARVERAQTLIHGISALLDSDVASILFKLE